MKDFCIVRENNPSLLIEIGESLGNCGVNIKGLSLSTFANQAVVHFLVNDENTVLKALHRAGINVTSISDVYILFKD